MLLVAIVALGVAAWVGAVSLSKASSLYSEGVQAWEGDGSGATGDTPPDGGSGIATAPETTAEVASEMEDPEANPEPTEGEGDEQDVAGDEQDVAGASEEVPEGTINVLVLGVDRRPNSDAEGYGSRSDSMMLVQIDPDTGKVELLSIPRDMYVETEPGVKDKINSAYNYGGVDQARAVVENFTGVSIDHYAIVDFRGFTDVVDAMGGVTLEIRSEFPPNWKMEQGQVQTIDGRHALLYARYRGTPRADLERIERQQQLVAALRSQALSWQSIVKLPEYVRVINENVETDLGLDAGVSLGRLLIQHGRNAQMTATQLKGEPTTLDSGSQVLVPVESENEIILQNFRD